MMANNKNEVFEYLIDQLRQQIPVVDVMGEIKRWSIDRSIAGRGNYTDDENAIIDAYIGLEHNPHKYQAMRIELKKRRTNRVVTTVLPPAAAAAIILARI